LRPEEHEAERLEEAISALNRGEAFDDVAASLPEELQAELAAAANLIGARVPVGSAGPSPSFALGLEEQLLTDLRLRRTSQMPRLGRVSVRAVAAVLAVAAVVVFMGIRQASPGTTLYPVRELLDEAQAELHLTAEGRSRAYLALGWRRIDEIRALLRTGGVDNDEFQPLLAGVVDSFAAALDAAVGSGDPEFEERVAAQAMRAGAELEALERFADAYSQVALVDARKDLEGVLVDPVFEDSPPRVGPAEAEATLPSTATDVAATEPAGAVLPTDAPIVVTATPVQSPTVPPTTAPPTVLPPTAEPTVEIEPTTGPTQRPSPTVDYPPTREDREPTPTRTPNPPTKTPGANAPSPIPTEDPRTPTRDVHPETSTPGPPIVPTEVAPGTAIPPDLTPVVPPTSEPTDGPGDRRSTPVHP
jgi:hypothetical protein